MSPASQPTNHEPMTTQTTNDDQVIAYSRKAFQGRDNIWVNEDLTKFRATLLWEARKLKKSEAIRDCWSFDGTILIRNRHNKIVPVHDQNGLLNANN